jgi:hypothetical protein
VTRRASEYCEICDRFFTVGIALHTKSDQHAKFVANPANYAELDSYIAMMKSRAAAKLARAEQLEVDNTSVPRIPASTFKNMPIIPILNSAILPAHVRGTSISSSVYPLQAAAVPDVPTPPTSPAWRDCIPTPPTSPAWAI